MRLAPEFLRLAGARSPLAPSLSRGRSLSPPQGRETGHGPVAGARPARFRALRAGARAPLRRRPRAPPPRSRPAPGSAGQERPRARNSATANRPPAPATPIRTGLASGGAIRSYSGTTTRSAWRAIGNRGSRHNAPRATGVAARAAGGGARGALATGPPGGTTPISWRSPPRRIGVRRRHRRQTRRPERQGGLGPPVRSGACDT